MGDILELKKNDDVPADVLLLYAENDDDEPVDIVFVDTMNLDGETNLKSRTIVDKKIENLKDLENYSSTLMYDLPNKDLDNWEGLLESNGHKQAGDEENLILRGCTLKNTKVAFGVVIYVGSQAKIMMNSKKVPRKVSNMMRLMNYFLYTVFGL